MSDQAIFGSGMLYAIPTKDAYGADISNPTPIGVGTLQEVSFKFGRELKELYGSGSFPEEIASAKQSVEGKASFARFSADLFNAMIFGQTTGSGIYAAYSDLNGVPAAASVTVTPPNSGTFFNDLGVRDAAADRMTRVASAPAIGQYAVNLSTGVYTFNASQTGNVYIDYAYSAASTTHKSGFMKSLDMGYMPEFELVFASNFQGKPAFLRFFRVFAGSLDLSFKNEDFSIPSFDFKCAANATKNVCQMSFRS